MTNNLLLIIRERINTLDLRILILLAERRKLVMYAGITKLHLHQPIRDKKREYIILNMLSNTATLYGLDSFFITSLFKLIIEYSVLTQQALLRH